MRRGEQSEESGRSEGHEACGIAIPAMSAVVHAAWRASKSKRFPVVVSGLPNRLPIRRTEGIAVRAGSRRSKLVSRKGLQRGSQGPPRGCAACRAIVSPEPTNSFHPLVHSYSTSGAAAKRIARHEAAIFRPQLRATSAGPPAPPSATPRMVTRGRPGREGPPRGSASDTPAPPRTGARGPPCTSRTRRRAARRGRRRGAQ